MLEQLPNSEVFKNLRHVHIVVLFVLCGKLHVPTERVFAEERKDYGEPVTAALFETGQRSSTESHKHFRGIFSDGFAKVSPR